MRNSRIIRKRGSRRKIQPVDLDITSLLDILVIMLVFLLKSYNSSGVVLNVPKGIILPKSVSSSPSSTGVIVQVSPTKIWVDDKEILDSKSAKQRGIRVYDRGGRRIIPLFNILVKKKQKIKEISKISNEAKKFSGIINLVVDKSVKYSYLKALLYTAAEAGFRKYKFVVLAEET